MSAPRLFIGIYPEGIVYADTAVLKDGDYKRLGFLCYSTLSLSIESECPSDLRERIVADAFTLQMRSGKLFRISGNVTVLLGDALESKAYERAG